MPTYEYGCPAGHQFERFYRKISDAAAQVACPECGQLAERRLSAGAGLIFKGSGFYITDYGKGGKKSETQPSAASDQGQGESKPDGTAAEPKSSDTKPAESKPAAPAKGSSSSE